jgi:co-chaperonin GroES (HSP10)
MSLTPLRGRVVVREIIEDSRSLWTPQGNPRERLTHRGIVLALGPPALTPLGAEVPYEYDVGAVVQFHFAGTEKGRIAPWTDGEPALWMAWFEIDAVIEA